MVRIRALFRTLLAALIAVVSVQMAVARGADRPVGQMVICAGHGVAVVLIGADGQPTRAAHLCPDCTTATCIEPGRLAGPLTPVPAHPACVLDAARIFPNQPEATQARIRAPPFPA